MNVSLARNLDYFVGIPVCFLLSLADNIKKVFFIRKPCQSAPKRIMFLGLSEMGSAILAYPAMKMARTIYPNAELYFCVFKENAEVIHILDVIKKDNILALNGKSPWALLIDTFRILHQIRKRKIDAVVDIELFSRFSAILCYLSKAQVRCGFHKYKMEGLYRGSLHTHKVMFNPYAHISKNFIALVQSLHADSGQMPLFKGKLPECDTALLQKESGIEEEGAIWSKLKEENGGISKNYKLVVLNPDLKSRLPLRRWPKENYEGLVKKLLLKTDIFVVTVGINYKGPCLGVKSDRYIDLTGKTTIRELLALFRISSLFISHDSGAAHLASLTHANIICIFGPETPVLYQPLSQNKQVIYSGFACSPCFSPFNHRRSICKDNKCLKTITVEDVYSLAERHL